MIFWKTGIPFHKDFLIFLLTLKNTTKFPVVKSQRLPL